MENIDYPAHSSDLTRALGWKQIHAASFQKLVASLSIRVEAAQVSTVALLLGETWNFYSFSQQIQSNFVVVIHPGSRTLRIGRATDTLPVTVPHVIARRHKQSGQPRFEDAWLLREGLNVCDSKPGAPIIQLHCCQMVSFLSVYPYCFVLISNRNQKATSRGRMALKWLIRLYGPRRCQTECGGLLCLLIRYGYKREIREESNTMQCDSLLSYTIKK